MKHPVLITLAASLALATGGTPLLFCQTYHMVTVRLGTESEFRVWAVTISGEMSEVQLIARPPGAAAFRMDPLGRFLIFARGEVGSPGIEGIEILEDDTLGSSFPFDRSGWEFFTNTLTPDGEFFLTLSKDLATVPATFHYESFRVGGAMTIMETGERLQVSPGGPPNLNSTTEIGSAWLPDGGYVLLVTGRINGEGFLSVLPVTASGEFTGLAQQISFGQIQPINGGWAVRTDQRLAVTGPMGDDRLTSFAAGPDGLLTPIDTYNFDEFGGLAVDGLSYHPSGTSLLTGPVFMRVPITRAGEFPDFRRFIGGGSGSPPAVSPDGRIAVKEIGVSSEGIDWGVFALDPAGNGDGELLQTHTFPFGYRDIAFIPPRTEEMLGDANGDGRRNAADVVTYLNHFDDTLTIQGPVPRARADADQDGDIDEKDLDWLLGFLLGETAAVGP